MHKRARDFFSDTEGQMEEASCGECCGVGRQDFPPFVFGFFMFLSSIPGGLHGENNIDICMKMYE